VAAVAGVTAQLARAYPATNEFKAGIAGAYDPLGILLRPRLTRIQTVALTLTGMVLLVVSLNISGMMQVRGAMRERELSIRQAIGASRLRLAQYLLSESIVLACAGGALASIVLFNIPSLLPWLTDNPIPPQILEALRVDVPMVALCVGLCLLTSLVFGWLPAMRFSRPAILSSLKDDAGGGGGMRVGRVHRVTAALQVAIAVPLLVMSGQSLDRLRATATNDLGFTSDLLYAVRLKLDGLATTGLHPRKSNWARPIDSPPYKAYPIISSIVFTFGGLKTDPVGRVVNKQGDAIPGLYAVGETQGLYYGAYTGATSVLKGLVFGRLSGYDAAQRATVER